MNHIACRKSELEGISIFSSPAGAPRLNYWRDMLPFICRCMSADVQPRMPRKTIMMPVVFLHIRVIRVIRGYFPYEKIGILFGRKEVSHPHSSIE